MLQYVAGRQETVKSGMNQCFRGFKDCTGQSNFY